MKKISLIFIILILVIASCEEKTDWPLSTETSDMIIVDGIITNEYTNQLITITKPVEELNATPEAVIGAQVSVFDGKEYHPFWEYPIGSGKYYSEPAAAGINRWYKLEIRHNNNYYFAEARMEIATQFTPLSYYELEDSAGFYDISSSPEIYNSDEPCFWEIWVFWHFLPEYENKPIDSCLIRMLGFTMPSIDVAQIFKPEKAAVAFPYGSVIIQKKYSLTDEHAEFLRTMLSETEWRGGLFDVVPANVTTNMSQGALGYFGVCAVIADTIWVH